MDEFLPKGYQIACLIEGIKPRYAVVEKPKKEEAPKPEYSEFYFVEPYNDQLPVNLFTKISDQAVEVYQAGFAAVGFNIHKH